MVQGCDSCREFLADQSGLIQSYDCCGQRDKDTLKLVKLVCYQPCRQTSIAFIDPSNFELTSHRCPSSRTALDLKKEGYMKST